MNGSTSPSSILQSHHTVATSDVVRALRVYSVAPLSSCTSLQQISSPMKDNDPTLTSHRLAPVRDTNLYARDAMAALHFEINQLLQNIQNAKREIQSDYNNRCGLANFLPIEFPVTKSVQIDTTTPASFYEFCKEVHDEFQEDRGE